MTAQTVAEVAAELDQQKIHDDHPIIEDEKDDDEEDDDDPRELEEDQCEGPKPSNLYGKFTWKIESFSEISKRELRSNVFEVGGYKWYILVYPQGCDVCNHLSLFLCVADHDKLLPGWSQFAQFTIAVVNKDPKKSKYSDTLHRFCKKEHDWGWKKFMELSKVLDGFTVADTLVIKAQVQVIRENSSRPFRCLDFQYRRELVRVYFTNIEGICRRFMEEKREKLGKLMEDTVRWGSFRTFWMAVEEQTRRHLAQEKADVVFKAIVKRFFNEKEVVSTLVMDALYSGCKALNSRNKYRKGKFDAVSSGQSFDPIVWLEKDMFILSGDILMLLERAANECLPSYKDDKGPQNRIKEVNSMDESGKDSIERDELRLTDLGRRTVEMFVLAHLFSNRVEVAYREAIALKRQEELIREEEAAGLVESELRAKREAAEKEKRYKKKQAKQRRKDRKEKEKELSEKRLQAELQNGHEVISGRKAAQDQTSRKDLEVSSVNLTEAGDEEYDSIALETSDDLGTMSLANEYGECGRVLWRREALCPPQALEASISGSVSDDTKWIAHGNRKSAATLDDTSSTCSSDSLPCSQPGTGIGPGYRAVPPEQCHSLPRRNVTADSGRSVEVGLHTCSDVRGTGEASSSSTGTLDMETVVLSLKERVQWLEKRLLEKEEEVLLLQEQLSLLQHKVGADRNSESLNLSGKTPDQRFAVEGLDLQPHTQSKEEIKLQEQTDPSSSNAGNPLSSGRARGQKTFPFRPCKNLGPSEELSRCCQNGDYGQAPIINGNDTVECTIGVITPKDHLKRSISVGAKSSDLSHNEKANSLFSKHAPILAKKSHAESITDHLNHSSSSCSPTSVVPNFSRPLSAPLFSNNPAASNSISVSDAVPLLARSNSAICGLNGVGESSNNANGVAVRHNGFTPVASPYPNTSSHNLQASSIGIVNHSPHSVPGPLYSGIPISVSSTAHTILDSSSSSCSRSTAVSDSLAFNGKSSTRASDSLREETVSFQGSNLCRISSVREEEFENTHCCSDQMEGNQNAVAFTFGTITQEVLHNEHKQLGQSSDSPKRLEQSLGRDELELEQQELQEGPNLNCKHKSEYQHYIQSPSRSHKQYQSPRECVEQPHQRGCLKSSEAPLTTAQEATKLTVVEPVNSSATLSEEFPHLDIINELLDEDKNLGKALSALLQHPNGPSFNNQVSLSNIHSFVDAQMGINDFNRNGRAVENQNGRGSLGLLFSQKHSKQSRQEGTSISLNENLQSRGSYSHIPLSQFQNVCTVSADRISSQYWPISQGMIPPDGYESSMQNGLTSYTQYPLVHSHRIAEVDSSGYDGFTIFRPLHSP